VKKIALRGKHGEGKYAIVDDEDYDNLSKFNWHYSDGYAARNTWRSDGKFKSFRMHRVIAHPPDNMLVDHINGNRLDNRKKNLRVCNYSENAQNQRRKQQIRVGIKEFPTEKGTG
jgi:hypothetical protein